VIAGGAGLGLLNAPRHDALSGRAAVHQGTPHTMPRPSPSSTPAPAAGYYQHAWLDGHPPPPLPVRAKTGVLVDLDARQELWARADRDSVPPASLAKMMTAAVALRHADLDASIKVPQPATQLEGDAMVMGLSPGEILTVRDLLYGVFMESANDAAETLAQAIEPRDQFLFEMNGLAGGWGLAASHFSNPTGLDDPGLRSSAYDLAVIAGHLVTEHPQLLAIAGTKQATLPATAGHKAYQLETVNGLVLHDYAGATGLKTGFTDDAGYCIGGTAARGSRHLLAVVLNSDTDIEDAKLLLDYGFSTAAPPA
jgi:D-alanyl-D-alanine carboxypeptidase (penicillin-binding protein 5/6)